MLAWVNYYDKRVLRLDNHSSSLLIHEIKTGHNFDFRMTTLIKNKNIIIYVACTSRDN